MRKLVMIRGNSGSGKSSVAKALQHRLGRNTLMIPQDIVRREMLWARDGKDTAAVPLLMTLLEYGYANSEVTILEGILNAEWYQPLFARAVQLFGEENICAYYYDLPFAETLKRHETKSNRLDFGEEDMRRWWNEKDYIGFIKEKTLTADLKLEETVALILADVGRGIHMEVQFGQTCDIDRWMELVSEISWNFPGLETAEKLDGYRETVLKFMGKAQALCVKDGPGVVGVLLFSRGRNMICCLGVSPRHRRRGIASALLGKALDELDRTREISVSTFREGDEKGTAPRALYRKFGFVEDALIEEFGYPNQKFILRP